MDIPPKAQRPQAQRPDATKRDGLSIIKYLTWATCESLYEGDQTLHFDRPDAAKYTSSRRSGIRYVECNTGSDAFQLPKSLLEFEWEDDNRPMLGLATTFNEAGIMKAASPSFQTIPGLIARQLEPDRNKQLNFTASMDDYTLTGAGRVSDISITVGLEHSSVLKVQNSGTSGHQCFQQFPFSGASCSVASITSAPVPSQHLLDQVIQYASDIRSKTKKPRKVLVALSLPPMALYYIVVDFDAQVCKVFDNAVKLEGPLANLTVADRIISPKVWELYWQSILMYFFVVLAFVRSPELEAVAKADKLRTEKRLPPDLMDALNRAVDLLDEMPLLTLRVRLSAWCTWLIHCLASCSANSAYTVWAAVIWQILGANTVLKTAPYLMIPQTGVLDLHNKSTLLSSWCPTTLPQRNCMWSDWGSRRFYVYAHLKLFIKIYSENEMTAFLTEINIFERLSKIQGKGIPNLYASGKITGSDECCMVMSYEGEPVKAWNDEVRHQVRNLVRLLHEHGIHHHDIASRNVLVDDRGKFTIIDFESSQEICGLSNCTEEADFGVVEGSEACQMQVPAQVAPESR